MAQPSNLPSLDSVPLEYLSTRTKIEKIEVPPEFQIWLTNMVDIINEALLEINARLVAGGL